MSKMLIAGEGSGKNVRKGVVENPGSNAKSRVNLKYEVECEN